MDDGENMSLNWIRGWLGCKIFSVFVSGLSCHSMTLFMEQVWHSQNILFMKLILYALTEGTPFAGGVFRMRLVLGKDFPAVPPKGYFLTKIFHPNVGHKGEICVNVLKRDWKAELGLRHVLLVRVTISLCCSKCHTVFPPPFFTVHLLYFPRRQSSVFSSIRIQSRLWMKRPGVCC